MTLVVRFAGFFRQLNPNGPPVYCADIREAMEDLPNYPVRDVVSFLRSGHPILDVMESCPDIVDGSAYIRGGSSVLSDGEWVWRWDLAHYVERYNVSLPRLFVARMMEESYRVPSVPLEDLVALTLQVNEELGFKRDPGAAPRGH
ncbi:hypothetical protein NLX86_18215 [Streptomyces sp. A3M-1-3]|uniref:hypothetical protein n=1 Tax=Streptomyces sp. A3M-1-3 TaxID=2962044 RepID=UPI0020B7433E|nr:hypothetical protein [Streptomyces sp. A3M-1-3]MCP3819960.1 hypothetical protein [Streptomyces sp. A3M-1-3]